VTTDPVGALRRESAVGIDPVADSPQVGHISRTTRYVHELGPGIRFHRSGRRSRSEVVVALLIRRTGKLTSNLLEVVAHIRAPTPMRPRS